MEHPLRPLLLAMGTQTHYGLTSRLAAWAPLRAVASERGRSGIMDRLQPTLENLALRLAAEKGGRVSPNDLAPYLPVSLEVIGRRLDEMVDDSVVFVAEKNGVKVYEFPELLDAPARAMKKDLCLSCDVKLGKGAITQLCTPCAEQIGRELQTLAEANAWPAQAVWQHEILYITSSAIGPIRLADVAGRSRLPLKRVRERLAEMAANGWAREILDERHGVLTYEFPKVTYQRKAFERHDAFIRTHPSSLKDEMAEKTVKALVMTLVIIGICLGLALCRMPFPTVILGGLIAIGVTVFRIFTHRSKVEPEQI